MDMREINKFTYIADFPLLQYCDDFDVMKDPLKYKTVFILKLDEEKLKKVNGLFNLDHTLKDNHNSIDGVVEYNEKAKTMIDKISSVVEEYK
jgi:hypothetical protein